MFILSTKNNSQEPRGPKDETYTLFTLFCLESGVLEEVKCGRLAKADIPYRRCDGNRQ